jgi:hypothetical protein
VQLSPSCQLRNCPHFTEPEVSLPRSQQPTTVPYPKRDKSNPHHRPTSLRSILSSCHQRLCFPIGLFLSGFHTKLAYAFFHTCYIRANLTHLDLIILIIFGEEYKSNSNTRKHQQNVTNKHGGWPDLFSSICSSETSAKFYRTAPHHIPGEVVLFMLLIFLLLPRVS